MRTRKDRQEIKALAKERFYARRGTAILLFFVYMLMAFLFGIIDGITEQLAGDAVHHIAYWIGTLLLGVITIHMYGAYLNIYEGKEAKTGMLFSGFAVNFWRKLGGYLWVILLIVLWALPGIFLFFIGMVLGIDIWVNPSPWMPVRASTAEIFVSAGFLYSGIALIVALAGFKGLGYSFAPYILANYPDVKAREAVRLSIRMATGYRGDLFVMSLSFFAWYALALAPIVALLVPGLILIEYANYGLGMLLTIIGGVGSALIYILFVGPYTMLAYAGNFVELRDRAFRSGEISPMELGIIAEQGESEAETAAPLQEERSSIETTEGNER